MKLFIFTNPPMYGGAEYIPVLATTEPSAYHLLCDYLKRVGREKDIDLKVIGSKYISKPEVPYTQVEYFETGEVLHWTIVCSQEIPEEAGVMESLIHEFLE